MSRRYRLMPTPEQEAILRRHCTHARFVWNLAVEQQSWWRPGRKSAPGILAFPPGVDARLCRRCGCIPEGPQPLPARVGLRRVRS